MHGSFDGGAPVFNNRTGPLRVRLPGMQRGAPGVRYHCPVAQPVLQTTQQQFQAYLVYFLVSLPGIGLPAGSGCIGSYSVSGMAGTGKLKSSNSIRRMYGMWKGYRKWFMLSIVLTLLSVLGMLLVPSLGIPLINEGILKGDKHVLFHNGLLMLVTAVFIGLSDSINANIAVAFSERTTHALRSDSYHQIQKMSFSNLDRLKVSNLLIRLTTDLQNVKMALQQGLINLFRAAILLVFATVIVIIMARELMWISISVIAVVCIGQALFLILVAPAYTARQKQFDGVNRVLRENMAGVRVVKAFVRQAYEVDRFRGVAEDLRAASLKPLRLLAYTTPLLFLVVFLGVGGFLYFGGEQVIQNTGLSIGTLTASIQYLMLALIPIFILVSIFPLINAGVASLVRVYELVDTEPDIIDRPGAVDVDPETIRGEVEFRGVSFSFQEDSGPDSPMFLKDINLVARPGEMIGILGSTGAGKSTLVNLVPRFYDVTRGTVTIDGIDVRDIKLDSLRKVVCTCLQEPNLFSGTIRDNIAFGAKGITDDEVVTAARAADAHGFIDSIPGKYGARVARRGANLSGGQRQRISIARALIRKPRVLILDDSTSACDLSTEARIQEAIRELMKDTTQLVVAQRISSVITADRIVLMDNGRIVGTGRHEELLVSSELYREICRSQLGDDYVNSAGATDEKG